MHRDQYGIIGQIQDDGSIEGGDSACWMGHWIYLTDETFPYVKTFEVKPGAYVRHPDPNSTNNGFGAYYKDAWNGCMSRDQLTGVLLALTRQKEHKAALRLIWHHAKRGFLFSYNTIKNGQAVPPSGWKIPDLTLFDIWALELRGFGKLSWLFWPLLCILDLQMLVSVVLDKHFSYSEPDCINMIGKLMASREFVPTPTSWLSAKIIDRQNLLDRLFIYWCGWRDSKEFVPVFNKKMDELLFK